MLYRLDDADDPLSEEDLERGLAEGRYVPIEPIPSSVSYRWMEHFADTVGSRTLRELLAVALDGRSAFHRFKDALRRFPVERERWFAFEAERLDQEGTRWLRDNGVEATLVRRGPAGS